MLALIVAAAACLVVAPGQANAEEYYYGIEIAGVVCGYSRIETLRTEKDGRDIIELEQDFFLKLSALGSTFDTRMKFTYHIDTATGNFIYHDSDIHQGDQHLSGEVHVEGDSARFFSMLDDDKGVTYLPDGTILENTLFFPHLKRDFVDQGLLEKTYSMYEVRESEIHDVTYTKAAVERLELAGRGYDAIALDRFDTESGTKATFWIDQETGMILKTRAMQDRFSFLSDKSIKKKIEVASLDGNIMADAGIQITDYHGITYMKVKAILEPMGARPTPESLNVPGQKFEGTVTDNLIDGIFEIEHPRYDGSNAPPFPPDFSGDVTAAKYLGSDNFVVADDPVLSVKATEITEGSKDSWEAACRLSLWVAENIDYAIPGGGTPRKTYDIRAGECGAHSLLLASFCRAVGIPARVVWGCMYVSGGHFGQHAWNEIYMGEAGWIPVDATAFEIDYVDSGHLRISHWTSPTISFGPREMKVFAHRVRGDDTESSSGENEQYAAYLGKYRNTSNGNIATVIVRDDALAVEIPGAAVFPLEDPGENGKWKSMIGHRIHFEFDIGEDKRAEEMRLIQLVPMPKSPDSDFIAGEAPEELKPCLGVYRLVQINADFTVFYSDGKLLVNDPTRNEDVGLKPTDKEGIWIDQYGKNEIEFEKDEEGNVVSLIIHSINRFVREN
jgi:transglutaminase-like putative cysteine protease